MPTKDASPGRTVSRNEEQIKTLPDKQKSRELTTTTPVLREILYKNLKAENILISSTKT